MDAYSQTLAYMNERDENERQSENECKMKKTVS